MKGDNTGIQKTNKKENEIKETARREKKERKAVLGFSERKKKERKPF